MIKALKLSLNLSILTGIGLMMLHVAYLVVVNTPDIWYRINPGAVEAEVRALTRDPFSETFGSINIVPKEFTVQSSPDASLPSGHVLSIPKIGVYSEILEGAYSQEQEILAQGVWRLPGYGTPEQNDKPLILAAHRWGDVSVSAAYRNQHMFINLPSLAPGDIVEVFWNQRKYTYRVTRTEENTFVSELSDLILLTCKFLDSPERILVYAERIA